VRQNDNRLRGGAKAVAAPGDERIGHHAHELVHGIERGLLRSRRGLARDLAQSRGRQRSKYQGNAAVVLKKLVSALATFCWLPLRPPEFGAGVGVEVGVAGGVGAKLSARFR
jgi:hypothetical protein